MMTWYVVTTTTTTTTATTATTTATTATTTATTATTATTTDDTTTTTTTTTNNNNTNCTVTAAAEFQSYLSCIFYNGSAVCVEDFTTNKFDHFLELTATSGCSIWNKFQRKILFVPPSDRDDGDDSGLCNVCRFEPPDDAVSSRIFFFRIFPFLLCGYERLTWTAEVGIEGVKMNIL